MTPDDQMWKFRAETAEALLESEQADNEQLRKEVARLEDELAKAKGQEKPKRGNQMITPEQFHRELTKTLEQVRSAEYSELEMRMLSEYMQQTPRFDRQPQREVKYETVFGEPIPQNAVAYDQAAMRVMVRFEWEGRYVEMGISREDIASHRTPDESRQYLRNAIRAGLYKLFNRSPLEEVVHHTVEKVWTKIHYERFDKSLHLEDRSKLRTHQVRFLDDFTPYSDEYIVKALEAKRMIIKDLTAPHPPKDRSKDPKKIQFKNPAKDGQDHPRSPKKR